MDEPERPVPEPEVAARDGLRSRAQVRHDLDNNSVRLYRSVTHPAKLSVEPAKKRTPSPKGDGVLSCQMVG